MRAKVVCNEVRVTPTCEVVTFNPVAKKEPYGPDGLDEDNTFAKWSPSGEFKLTITNPALFGVHKPGLKYYVDFTLAPA